MEEVGEFSKRNKLIVYIYNFENAGCDDFGLVANNADR